MLRATNIDRYCVKVSVRNEQGQVINQGSGVIIKSTQNYYMLTARHCVAADGDGTAIADMDKIWIESQLLYNAPFQQIDIIKLIHEDRAQDYALYAIAGPPLHEEMPVTQIGENPGADETVFFRGFQARDPNQSRRFSGITKDIGLNEFKITLDNDTFKQGGQMGADVAKGLSGSGVFMFRNEKLYLVGHLKSVVDEYALNDDVKCGIPASWKQHLPDVTYIDLAAPNNLPWAEDRRKLNDFLIRRVYIEMQKYRQRDVVEGGKKTTFEESVVANYIGVVAVEIRRLNAIGKGDKKSEGTQFDYINTAATTARRCVQLLSFIFLSRWWDNKASLNLSLDDATKNELRHLFGSTAELSLTAYLGIVRSLIAIFQNNPALLSLSPLDELDELEAECQPGRDFYDAFVKLEEIERKLDDTSFTLTDCFVAESELTIILETLSFLSTYRMAAIKEVVYHQARKNTANYQHSYCEIREYKEQTRDKKIAYINYTSVPVSTDAVFFYKDDYENGVNLSPFVIDLNSIDARTGAKIYFYKMRDVDNNTLLIYTCISDGKDEEIVFKNSPDNMPDIEDVLMDKSSTQFLQYRKDVIYRLFIEAQRDILS